MLSRMVGSWPTEDFKDLAVEVQQAFFASIADKSKAEMRGMLEELFERIEKKEYNFSEGGQFLPLSVWERKGFDVGSIETKSGPEDIREHPVLGKMYRVRVHSLIRSSTSATQRSKPQPAGQQGRLCIGQCCRAERPETDRSRPLRWEP